MNYKNIISFISSLNIVKNMTVVLACGSALKKHNPEDVDFIIYTENKQDFSLLFKDKLQNEKIKFVHVFIKKLNVHSIKFEYQGQKLSFLIEDYNSIEAYLKRANDPNVYVDINIFDFQFCYPLIYRKWIIETDYLLGCKKTYESLLNIVKSIRIPKQAIDISKKKILNTIKYLKRKEKSSILARNIIQNELANDLIIFLYVLNNKLIGTVPYIEDDLQKFEKGRKLSNIAILLIQNRCEVATEKILKLVEKYYEII